MEQETVFKGFVGELDIKISLYEEILEAHKKVIEELEFQRDFYLRHMSDDSSKEHKSRMDLVHRAGKARMELIDELEKEQDNDS